MNSVDKIRALKRLFEERALTALIEVDGGINLGNAAAVASAGADILVMGSAFFHSGDYGELVRQFRENVGSG